MKSTAEFKFFWLIWLALAVRVQELYHFPKYAMVGLELSLLLTFFAANRKDLPKLLIKFDKLKDDIWVGIIFAIVWASFEIALDHINGIANPLYIKSLIYLPAVLVVVGWASALYEELLFRSALLAKFVQIFLPTWLAVLIQGTLFFLAHGARYFHSGQWDHALLTGLFGLLLGFLAWSRQSITSGWVAHAIVNSYGIMFIPPDLILNKAIWSWVN